MKTLATCLSVLIILASCGFTEPHKNNTPPNDFNEYWYGGKAEISSYELTQARYGETHSGKAVLVFVTEPFSESKQVKLDYPKNTKDNISVLKLNFTKKFLTGIYPYSMMMSSFTPVSYNRYANVMKLTTSSQEWCGHTFFQLNDNHDHYKAKGFSYFESEGDINEEIPKVILEDELWTRIRLNPKKLPLGDIKLLPGTFYLRLRHEKITPLSAIATLSELKSSDFATVPHMQYSLEYKNRNLTIFFEKDFPYTILGWQETHQSGFGLPKKLTTSGKLIKTIKSAYWGEHNNKDRELRKRLGLTTE